MRGRIACMSALLLTAAPVAAQEQADGVVVKPSAHGVIATLDRLETLLNDNGITVLGRIDHAEGARMVGADLAPTELLIFGNPRLGTPLMESARTIGLDLPMKALAWEDAGGKVWLAYNDPEYLARRHGIEDRPEEIKLMRGALDQLTDAATGK